MARNKPRVQLALYARPKHPGTYHYALFVTAKDNQGPTAKHHEESVIDDIESEPRLLVRVKVAKVVANGERMQRVIDGVPVVKVKGDAEASNTFSCVSWAQDVFLELVTQKAVMAKYEGWDDLQRRAVEYVDRKREAGRWDGSWKDGGVPLVDLFTDTEIIP
ncbi:hypothetical protein LTR95_008974 [Oleoguttula sp. CCFEE 5521]